MRLAVDVMGGDHGPEEILQGVRLGLADAPLIDRLYLVGRPGEIEPALGRIGLSDPRIEIRPASEVLTMEDKPVHGLRRKKDCSLLRAVELVKDGLADAIISAGNTGGIVAASAIRLRTLPGVERPTIACIMPSRTGAFVLVDGGANPECTPENLVQFAVMGSLYAREMLGVDRPRVGVLSNGTEEIKGTDLTRAALARVKETDLNCIGYCEGHQLFSDEVDVVVCDGFVGNIVLKTAESLGQTVRHLLRTELTATPLRKLGALIARPGLRAIRDRLNPEIYGGAPLLGLNGNVIKIHGSARRVAVMHALRQGQRIVTTRLGEQIVEALARLPSPPPTAPGSGFLTMAPFTHPRASRPHLRTVSITGVGSYVPERVLTNRDLESIVETTDEWITSRTGIRERRLAADDEATSDLASRAALRALENARLEPADLDLIVVATITPDMLFPSTACLVQRKLGATRAAAFDIEAACSGFVYGLEIGANFVASHSANNVLVIGAEKMSSVIDWTDRNTCVLFGDGAGAAVLQNRPSAHGLLTTCLGADGAKAALLEQPAGGSACPATADSVARRLHFLRMDGKETFKNAVNAMVQAAGEALRRCDLTIDRIRCIIPHQANLRILSAVAERLGATEDQLFINVERYGNTSAASVAIALDEAVQQGRIRRGDLVMMVVFGAGLTWGAAIIEW